MIEQLQEQIKVVVKARQQSQGLNDRRKALYDDLQMMHSNLFSDMVVAKTLVENEEMLLRELTLQAYAETGNKTPAVGVGIREVTKLNYDGKVAFDWAKSHKMALQLDKKAFEKIAKADTPDFVTISQEPQATIATNLDNTTREEK